eukprot:CAMPEP_0201686764 /NCGR_PEP_ID=MMETSP0578-20130828/1088_1 /ASSEMBLY_ACC=CAM_ASM_000663 /TAXON_ID=267565 /ORGANISM="Skeletonema grethea, Strain CCMP 1804" /LENGTH=875 /DNA_ID=CAMNT_0048170859 /DNA_START=38 /DNA_END=2665 /DNA_ORIENTATION=-
MPLFGKSSSNGSKDDKKDDKKSSRRSSTNTDTSEEKKKKKSSSKDKDRKKKSSSSSDERRKSSSSSSSSDKDKKKKSSSSSDDKKKSSKRSSSSSKPGSSSTNSISSSTKSASTAPSSAASAGGPDGGVPTGPRSVTFRVQVPPNVKPGEEFSVYAGKKIVKVRCPRTVRPGQSLQITLPVNPADLDSNGNGREGSAGSDSAGGGLPPLPNEMQLPPDSDNVSKIPNQTLAPGEQPAYMVKIPEGVRGGTQFPVTINGQQLMVTCPQMARHPMSVRIVPPPPSKNMDGRNNNGSGQLNGSGVLNQQLQRRIPNRVLNPNKQTSDKTQMFEVVVPTGVRPGQPFALLAGGVRVLVTCPKNAVPGKTIRFHLPIALVNANKDGGPKSKLAEIKLSYDKDGWTRTIRATDMKFQWTRFDTDGNVDTRNRFDTERSAYVRKLDWEADDDRMRKGRVSLVTPDKGVVDSKIKSANGTDLVTFEDIATAQNKSYEDKIQWFQDTCAQLCVEWNEGHMRMNVRRDYLLSDSMEAVMSLSRKDLRKVWRFEFIGEAGIDAGGLAREWFELVTEEVFDPDMGLWQNSATNQMCMQINPASEISCPDDHLIYFRFIGRVMGKAMFDRQLVKGHMVKHMYKHILGWPIMFNDLKDIDEEYYNSLKGLKDLGADVEYVYMDFTATEETLGVKQTVDLVPGGADIDVTEENLPEYIEACLKYRMLGRYEAQVNELLLGFFDVIPEPLLTIFDFQELELLMCGLPEIEMEDWKKHTEYSGEYDRDGPNHDVCIWFWEVVSEYDQELKARLLQFVTGTSGVPAKGFGSLQGNDGNVRKFTIHGVSLETCVYPRSHTCFNRIDLPLYEEKEELEEKLKIAITMASTGFDIE